MSTLSSPQMHPLMSFKLCFSRNFISIYKINRTLHGCLGIRILSSRAESSSHSFASLTLESPRSRVISSISLPKTKNVRDVSLVCFKPPTSRSLAYCDCNPIRVFETFDISKEPISKTSIFWMFWYKRGCNWLGAVKGMALWSRGFSRRSLFKT